MRPQQLSCWCTMYTVHVMHQCSTITGPVAGDFPRASPLGNLFGLRKSLGRRGWISQYLPSFGGVPTFSHHQSFCREWIRKFFPVASVKIDSVKINPSLPCTTLIGSDRSSFRYDPLLVIVLPTRKPLHN